MVRSGKDRERGSLVRVSGLAAMRALFEAVSDRIGRFGPFSLDFRIVSESLTRGKSGEKESPRLLGQNRRMFPAMRTILQTPCERVQLTLTVALLAACAANVALVCAWL
jgi:hypothetical protein